MPTITVANDTEVPLHIALRHISPVYYENNVAPGGKAVFKHVGRVWFTVEARVARSASGQQEQSGNAAEGGASIEELDDSGASETKKAKAKASKASKTATTENPSGKAKENNEYTLMQQVAAPIAATVAGLSLGAGAIYIGMAASAAGGITAALSTISAQVGTAAASQAPTARRLYTFAKKGQKVVQIGQVLGIGGGAWLGSQAAKGQVAEAEAAARGGDGGNGGAGGTEKDKKQAEKTDMERLQQVKQILMDLMESAAVKSHGWYMKADRTIRIKGGPRAAEVEEWLIIETDTVTPFEVVPDDPNDDKPDPTAQQEAMQKEIEEARAAEKASQPT